MSGSFTAASMALRVAHRMIQGYCSLFAVETSTPPFRISNIQRSASVGGYSGSLMIALGLSYLSLDFVVSTQNDMGRSTPLGTVFSQ
jgi:hypothetical protein